MLPLDGLFAGVGLAICEFKTLSGLTSCALSGYLTVRETDDNYPNHGRPFEDPTTISRPTHEYPFLLVQGRVQ